jgi:hypothetical protein
MKKLPFIILGTAMVLSSCEYLNNIEDSTGLSDSDIVEGLKTALNVGTDSSSTKLSLEDGYYGNALIKIPLPDEAVKVQNEINAILSLAPTLSNYLDLDTQFENVVKSINRAAEESAKDAAPIFKNAITSLSISQGLEILQGSVPDNTTKSADFDSTAATKYLENQTFTDLTDLYAPKIDLALDKNLGLGFSANQAWSTLRTNYNNAVNSIKGNFLANAALQLTGYDLQPLQTESIGVFATEKALNGLFTKVGEEEIKIRRDPWQWISTVVGDILTKVFGSQN